MKRNQKMSNAIEKLLEGNHKWSTLVNAKDKTFFTRSAEGQNPQYLWIGCADSRVPETQITSSQPGDIFVHRNIANMVVANDTNLLSVLFYAVKVLQVEHIIVCGHYGCGGVQAALSGKKLGLIDQWITHIKEVETKHKAELESIQNETQKAERLVELNVMEQVNNLSKTDIIQESWKENNFPTIHGLVYRLSEGTLNDLGISVNDGKH